MQGCGSRGKISFPVWFGENSCHLGMSGGERSLCTDRCCTCEVGGVNCLWEAGTAEALGVQSLTVLRTPAAVSGHPDNVPIPPLQIPMFFATFS